MRTAVQPPNRLRLGLVLLVAMAAATALPTTVGLLGTTWIAEFGISREQLGVMMGLSVLVGGASSPVAGSVTDRVGGRTAIATVFAAAGCCYLVLSASPGYSTLLSAAAIGGIATGLSNPATNKLIAIEIPGGQRANLTGLKQSGVQAGVVLLGLLVPIGLIHWGWRATVAAIGLLWLAFFPVALRASSSTRGQPSSTGGAKLKVLGSVWHLSVYGLGLGVAGGITLLLPLFTEEALGMTRVTAGRVTALAAASAVAGRLSWARHAERRDSYDTDLRNIAFLAAAAVTVIAGSLTQPWLVWVGASMIGLSAGSWNSVGMLATIVTVGPTEAGSGTGWVQLGFLLGLGSSGPVYGILIDQTHSYLPVLVLGFLAALFGSVFARRRPRSGLSLTHIQLPAREPNGDQ